MKPCAAILWKLEIGADGSISCTAVAQLESDMRERRRFSVMILCAAAAVAIVALVARPELQRQYRFYRFRTEPEFFFASLQSPAQREWIAEFVETDSGRDALFAVYLAEIVERYVRREVKPGTLIWLGKKPGLQPSEPHVAVNHFERSGAGCRPHDDHALAVAIREQLGVLQGGDFTAPSFPRYRFTFMRWREENAAEFPGIGRLAPPSDGDIVCSVVRFDEGPSGRGTSGSGQD